MVPNQRKKFGLRMKPKILRKKFWIRDIQKNKTKHIEAIRGNRDGGFWKFPCG